jgi:hypothetical protein
MAKFKNDNLDLETGEHIDFDDADTIQMGYDGAELYINSTVSGIRAAQPHQMVRYDQLLEAVSGTNEFIELTDTPATYSGLTGYHTAIKSSEDGLEFSLFSEPDLYIETTRAGNLVTYVDAWRDNSKTFQTYKETITRAGGFVSQVITEIFDVNDGVTITDTYTNTFVRSGGLVVSETQVRT